MVRRCAWGTCNSDERYPDKLNGAYFIPFPKPKTQLNKCLRWIKACGRPHSQLNTDKIDKNKFVCSKHFVNASGPTLDSPDPIPADGSHTTPSRPPPKKRILTMNHSFDNASENCENMDLDTDEIFAGGKLRSISTQTEEPWISSMELLAVSAEMMTLKSQIEQKEENIKDLQALLKEKDTTIKSLKSELRTSRCFGVEVVLRNQTKLKNLFKYYTGITYVRFLTLLAFLIPHNFNLEYEKGRTDIKSMSVENGLLLTLCRLRHDFGLKDLSVRFGLSLQSTGIVFNTWIDHMYFKLGQLSIWPHRDTIISNMPADYKRDFPTSLVIIDGTEFKTQTPCALGLQSQMYSDYKSSTTLKALIGCDPNGSVVFVSELFTGSISDKAITEQSGFYEMLKVLKDNGYVHEGDAIMADKGFTIKEELKSLGLNLNIPPFLSSGTQMSAGDTSLTMKIAKHRIHIERLIAKVKVFRIIAHRVPTKLFKKINKIWSICSILTLFQDVFVKDKV